MRVRKNEPSGWWKLEDAKARFSEVVRRAENDGPQLVTVRGREAVVVLSTEQFAAMQPRKGSKVPLVDFLQSLDISGLDLSREPDFGREIEL